MPQRFALLLLLPKSLHNSAQKVQKGKVPKISYHWDKYWDPLALSG